MLSGDCFLETMIMNAVTRIGIDLGKHCFHLHEQNASGRMVFRKKVWRSRMLTMLANFPTCRVVITAWRKT